MKILKLLLAALAATIMISGCGGGGTTTNPINTDLGTLSFSGASTLLYTPSDALAGQLSSGNVYCTFTRTSDNSVISSIFLTPVTGTNNWKINYSGSSSSEIYQQVVAGSYIGDYKVTLMVYVNGAEKIVSNNYYSIQLNFTKNSSDNGDQPPPPPW